jgi:dienelactone hydrolase
MPRFTSHLDGFHDVADQMRADIWSRAQECSRRRAQEKAALGSVADFEAYRTKIRDHFMEAIGGLPSERTPLRPRVTGVLQQEGFRIEKVLFESQPEYFVSAACYVPDNVEASAPGVLFFCGHSATGKAHDTYQRVCRDLARNGFVVLAIDPIGQGERLQFWKDGQPQLMGTLEHTHAGLPFFLMGASVARHFVWDGIRAFDYLASRDEVDESRIGVTGNSGGGTQTCYLMMCEPRLVAAVPCTFPTTLEAILQSGNPQDMEQIVFSSLMRGPDHDDFLTALAPRPVMAGAVASDFFPIEGTLEAVDRARKIYDLYGRGEQLHLAVDDSLHCYSAGLRQACVNWFRVHLQGRAPDFVISEAEVLAADQLNATRSGQVLLDFPEAKTISDHARALLASLPSPSQSPEELRTALAGVLGVSQSGSRSAPIFARHLGRKQSERGENREKIWFFSAPRIIVSGVLHHPQASEDVALPLTILVCKNGTDNDSTARVEALLRDRQRVLVFDVRGVGGVASRAISVLDGTSEYAPPFDTEYKLACDAALLGLSTMGLRVFDILRVFDYLKTRSDTASVALHGVGEGAIWAYFAAVLEAGFTEVTCEKMLLSFRELCREPHYESRTFNIKIMAWGLLRCGDVRDFLPCLAGRSVHFIDPLDACAHIVNRGHALAQGFEEVSFDQSS